MRFPINHSSMIIRPPSCTARYVLSCANINYFILASVTVDRCFNATSKKENNTERMSIHFLINVSEKTSQLPLADSADEKNQTLKLLFVTAAINLVLQLDILVRKCSSFMFIITSNTLM